MYPCKNHKRERDMKGYRFYAEYESKKARRTGTPEPQNVVAVFLDEDNHPIYHRDNHGDYFYEGVSAVFSTPNSAVCGGSAHDEYIAKTCKRVSEAAARKIHPQLFQHLEQ